MSYNVNKLTTVADCDQALAIAAERKSDLQFEQTISGKGLTDQEKAIEQTTASLISVNAEITGVEAAIAVLPDGKVKQNNVSKLRRLNDRKDNLEERLQKGGAALLLDTELENSLLQLQVAEIDAYIAAVTARKGAL